MLIRGKFAAYLHGGKSYVAKNVGYGGIGGIAARGNFYQAV
jgi:hypothetical protein